MIDSAMINLTVYMDDHHIGSARELALTIADNWPAMTIRLTDPYREWSQMNPDANHSIAHTCEFCMDSLMRAATREIQTAFTDATTITESD